MVKLDALGLIDRISLSDGAQVLLPGLSGPTRTTLQAALQLGPVSVTGLDGTDVIVDAAGSRLPLSVRSAVLR